MGSLIIDNQNSTENTALETLFPAKYRGSCMSDRVLLNSLNKMKKKKDEIQGLPSILSLFCNEFKNSIIQEHKC